MTAQAPESLSRVFHPHGGLEHIFELVRRTKTNAEKSDHHLYKVGTTLLSITSSGKMSIDDKANHIPKALKFHRVGLGLPEITSETRFGSGNPTVHGEFSVLINAPATAERLYLACDTPFCPNCMKKAILRGVNALFLDSSCFDTESNQERFTKGWEEMSLPLARAAQMPVYMVNTENETITAIVEGLPPHKRPKPTPVHIAEVSNTDIIFGVAQTLLAGSEATEQTAIAIAHKKSNGKYYMISAKETMSAGIKPEQFIKLREEFSGNRYQPEVCPIIQLTMMASLHGLTLEGGMVACNYAPSASRMLDLAECRVSDLLLPQAALEEAHETLAGVRMLMAYEAMNVATLENGKFQKLDITSFPDLML